MPLARIISNAPGEVASLCQYLCSLGYEVELVNAESLPIQPGPLDVQGSSSEDVSARNTDLTEGANSGRRVIAYDITGRAVEFEDEQLEAAVGRSAFAEGWQVLCSAKRKVVANLQLTSEQLRKLLADGRHSVDQYRTRYEQVRVQAAIRVEESRIEQRAQRQAFKAERSRRQLERARRKAQIEIERERLEKETRQAREAARLAGAALAHREPTTLPQPQRYRRDSDLRKAAFAAAVLALLAILGLGAYRDQLTRPPLSNRDLVGPQDVTKTVSFDATTVPLQPIAAQHAASEPSRTELTKSTVDRKIDVAVKPTAAPAVVRKRSGGRADANEDEFVAEDEVINYRRRPSGLVQARSNTEPKRISDLE